MLSFDEQLIQLIKAALAEDIGDGDHSTLCCIPAGVKGRAELKIKQPCILAGMAIAEKILQYKEPSVKFIAHKKDGDAVQADQTAFEA